MNKKKILIVTRNLPPLIGGMERLNWHIADELSQDNDVILLSHTEAKQSAPKDCDFYGVSLNPLALFLILAFFKTFLICLRHKPDVLFAGSGLTAPITVFWAKVFRKKSIIYIHGLDIATNQPVYNLIWIPFIRHADNVVANSSPTYNICINKGIESSKLNIIHPGVDYPPKSKKQASIYQIKNQYHLYNHKILISVGRLTQRKGMNEFVDLCLPHIVKEAPNTKLVIIGDTPQNSLNKNLQSKELILSTAKKHGIDDKIIFVGNISNDEVLSCWYYLADIHVFPVKHIPNDPEGFGMVAIEAAAHGTPTVAFATGGVIDAVKNNQSGYLIEAENYSELSTTISKVLNLDLTTSSSNCEKFAQQFGWINIKDKLNQLL
ncbi:glycosyltransferase family 4 protein [Acinetobacter bouvetii]|uniref:GDP-mannose-dependent alpha-(1-6)-phosphatidylinositol monomannoside mannosyltransferase n=1 Tax=Acinetobacter bouvetii TaxID=202951 RepID=A0A811GB41_9GAMM|nr:glycosyltransferase family 4 protein [Acinetobacter bouvetii]CAB1208086.1 GDP-mannose-dependent alpha-(1-6)-phosphatidylinositol monomannoside mannosyltransferase [Acinetobacter bouvetii]